MSTNLVLAPGKIFLHTRLHERRLSTNDMLSVVTMSVAHSDTVTKGNVVHCTFYKHGASSLSFLIYIYIYIYIYIF